ncbi:MAG: GNAT family N-acetyltransferase [Alistipes sp.]|nr:GNAT family N-acetyltransferase [Alistipes sp.]
MIRKALLEDLDAIMEIIGSAQALLKERGVDQWQDGYPDRDIIISDILKGECYLLCHEGAVAATAVISTAGEVTYNQIDGAWLDSNPYIVIHRLAVGSNFLGQGRAKELFLYAEELGQNLGIKSIRVDTHKDNIAMQSLLKSLGYILCGEITLLSGAKRVAWQLITPHEKFGF